MNPIEPIVHELLLDPDGARKWKFTGKMKQGLDNTLAARMWWVNSNTKISTFLTDRCVDTSNRPPPGLSVFSPLAPPEELACVVCELERLYQEESEHHTLAYIDYRPEWASSSIHFLFTGEDPYVEQLSLPQVIAVLTSRAPAAAKLVQDFAESVQSLLGIPRSVLESTCVFQLLKYTEKSGLNTHIDNVSRMGGTAGPVLCMSLGGSGVKHMDLFPVLDDRQDQTPLRITTPVGSVILLDGIARMEWSHGIPEGDPSVRWSIMFKFKQVCSRQVGYSSILETPVYESELNCTGTLNSEPPTDIPPAHANPPPVKALIPHVYELKLDSERNSAWKFTKNMKSEFKDNPAGRLWWVNTNTKVRTYLNDKCIHTSDPLPPGLHVFPPLASPETLDQVIVEFQHLYHEERENHTLPDYNMIPYNNIHVLFTSKNPDDRQMTYLETMDILQARTPTAAGLIRNMSELAQQVMGITQRDVEERSNIGLIQYFPHGGFISHIDNILRAGGTAGPVFTMSLGGNNGKPMDMFPVIEHWKKPLRVCTPVGSVILLDGASRLEWSHGIPEGDPSERWTIMLKFAQVTERQVGFSKTLRMPVFASQLNMCVGEVLDDTVSEEQSELLTQLSELDAKLAAFEKRQTSTRQEDETLLLVLLAEMLKAS